MKPQQKKKAETLVKRIVEALNSDKTGRGGQARLAERLSDMGERISSSGVAQLVNNGWIPVKRVRPFVTLCRELDVKVQGRPAVKWDFRPDIYEFDEG